MDEVIKSYYDISLSAEDIKEISKKHKELSSEAMSNYKLDKAEKLICWVTGLVAGIVDAFFVTNYKNLDTSNISKLNSSSLKDSGYINGKVDNRIRNLFSPEKISNLENKFKVPYDASTSIGLDEYVLGLNPRTHRLQSLGHDPIMGFYYGVRDILNGQFTAVDNAGQVIIQSVSSFDSAGINIFKAIAIQIGHLLSDISTPAGLPFPFMSQLLKIKGGNIEGFSYNRLIKNMYAKGYNFNHLLSLSVPALIIEVSNRLSYFIYSLSQGKSFKESIPFNKPKLDKMLFTSYLISVGCNSIKIIATRGNIFAINPTLWIGTLKCGLVELKRYLTDEKEKKRHAYVLDKYNQNIAELDELIEAELLFFE